MKIPKLKKFSESPAKLFWFSATVTTGRWQESAGGLLNRVVASENVLDTAMEFATAIAANPPLAVRAARHVLRRSRDISEEQSLALEAKLLDDLAQTEDAIEGPRAFLEKRPAVFKGR